MTAQLHRSLIVRPAAVPDWNCRLDGFEVDVRDWIRQRLHCLEQCFTLDDAVPFAQRTPLSRCDGAELYIVGQIADARPARCLELRQHFFRHLVQIADMIGRRDRPAAIHERTGLGPLAMRANLDVWSDWKLCGDQLVPDFAVESLKTSLDEYGDVFVREE